MVELKPENSLLFLVEIFLPIRNRHGVAFPGAELKRVRDELTERFGGVTAFTRSPAEGLWRESGNVEKDDIAIYEVMVSAVDHAWWRDYARTLESRLDQHEILIRATRVERL